MAQILPIQVFKLFMNCHLQFIALADFKLHAQSELWQFEQRKVYITYMYVARKCISSYRSSMRRKLATSHVWLSWIIRILLLCSFKSIFSFKMWVSTRQTSGSPLSLWSRTSLFAFGRKSVTRLKLSSSTWPTLPIPSADLSQVSYLPSRESHGATFPR